MMRKVKVASALVMAAVMAAAVPAAMSMAATTGSSTYVMTGGWPAPPEFQGNPYGDGGVGSGYPLIYSDLFQYQRHTNKIFFQEADSLKNVGNETIIHIRPNAKWQNGTPFTSKDVWAYYILINSDELTPYLDGLDGIQTPNAKTVIFKWRSPAPFDQLRDYLIAQGLNGLIDYNYYAKFVNETYALFKQAKPAVGSEPVGPFGLYISPTLQAKINKVYSAFEVSGPKEPMGTGPYEVVSVTPTQMLLKKWNGYWGAGSVHFEHVLLETVASPTQGYAGLDAGQLTVYNSGQATPLDVVKSVLAGNKNVVYYHWPDVASVSLEFDQAHAPFNELKFRQAVAYIVNRRAIQEADDYFGSVPAQAYIGMPRSVVSQWMPNSVIQKMTTYSSNSAKAAALLKQLGWHKGSNGKWVDPQGKVPLFTIGAYSGNQEHVNAAELVANQLTQFGLPTQVLAQNGSIYYGNAETGGKTKAGDFDMTVDWGDVAWGYTYPYYSLQEAYEGMLGEIDHLPTKEVDGTSEVNMTVTGPTGQKVNVYQALNTLAYGGTSAAQRTALISDLSYAANQNVLGLDLFLNAGGLFVNTAGIKGWPLSNDFVKDDRVVGPPLQNKFLLQEVIDLDTGETGFYQLENGMLSPKG